MEFRRLSYFVSVAELGSLTRASSVLRIAQPALTRQIRMLEQEMGFLLFTRTRRGMKLTNDGRKFFENICRPLRELEEVIHVSRRSSADIKGSVAIAMTPMVSYFLAQPIMEYFSREHSNISMRITEGRAHHLDDWLESGEVDICIDYIDNPDDSLSEQKLIKEQLFLVSSNIELHPHGEIVSLKKLSQMNIFIPTMTKKMIEKTNNILAETRINFHLQEGIDSFHALKEMVKKGMGSTIVPLSPVIEDVIEEKLSYFEIENPIYMILISKIGKQFLGSKLCDIVSLGIKNVVADLHKRGLAKGEILFS